MYKVPSGAIWGLLWTRRRRAHCYQKPLPDPTLDVDEGAGRVFVNSRSRSAAVFPELYLLNLTSRSAGHAEAQRSRARIGIQALSISGVILNAQI